MKSIAIDLMQDTFQRLIEAEFVFVDHICLHLLMIRIMLLKLQCFFVRNAELTGFLKWALVWPYCPWMFLLLAVQANIFGFRAATNAVIAASAGTEYA